MYAPVGTRDVGSRGTRQVTSSAVVIYPELMRFCRCSYIVFDADQPNTAMVRKGRRGNTQ
jgi:hypothetical protein